MASAASKSTSRRGAATEPKAPPPSATTARRRSHSVSAVSRKTHVPIDDNTFISTEFSNSRDNPLFWSPSSSPPDKEETRKISEIGANNNTKFRSLNSRVGSGTVGGRRGRSVTRNPSDKNGIGRSLSRVRGRSVSRGGVYESKKEQPMVTSFSAQSRNERTAVGKNRTYSAKDRVDTRVRVKNPGATTVQNQVTEWSEDDSACSLQISNLEDGISIGSFSEAEEKTIKAVCEDLNSRGERREGDMPPNEIYETVRSEVRRAIYDIQNDLGSAFRRNDVNVVTSTGADMSSDLANPDAVELISDIRREYAIKLEESEERARKLRADLAIEEQRGEELDRILKEILPHPKTSGTQRSRRGRRTSNERKRMSKRLSEEAMAYFDECVSISTFDSSDFSASEDPHYSSFGATIPNGASPLAKGSPSTSSCYDQGSSSLHQKRAVQKQLYRSEESGMTAKSSSEEAGNIQPYDFSFVDRTLENAGLEVDEDIRSCIKHFERFINKDDDAESCYYDAGEYSIRGQIESVLMDRVLYRSRIESGGLLLCGAAIPFLPYASVL